MSEVLRGLNIMPEWYWNKLQTEEARNNYVEQAHAFDKTDEIEDGGQIPNWNCRQYSNQTMINANWITNPTDTANFNKVYPFNWKDMGLEGYPLMDVKTVDISGNGWYHEMNGTFTGDYASEWSSWNFSEPQFDQMNVQPGEAYMPKENSRLYIRALPTLGVWGWPEKYEIDLNAFVAYNLQNESPSLRWVESGEWDEVIFQRDKTNPTISTTFQNGETYELEQTGQVTVTDATFRDAWISWDGGKSKSKLEQGVNSVAVPNKIGNYKGYIYAGDHYWNEVLDSVMVSVAEPQDTTPPTIEWNSNASGTYNN